MMQNVSCLVISGMVLLMLVPSTAVAEERFIFDEQSQQWVAETPKEPGEGPLAEAEELIDQSKFRRAERVLKKYNKYLKTNEAPDRAQAMLTYAEVAFMRGKYYRAHKRYRRVIEAHPQTREFALALRRELDIAKAWLGGRKRLMWNMFKVPAYDEALDILSQIEEQAAGHRIAEVALRARADYHFRTGQFELAQIDYRRLVNDYRSAGYTKMAMLRSAESALATFPGTAFDDAPLLESRELYSQYLDRFPDEARKDDVESILQQITGKQAEKEYRVGEFYIRIRKPEAGAYYFNFVLKTWPDTLWADRAHSELLRLGFEPEAPLASAAGKWK